VVEKGQHADSDLVERRFMACRQQQEDHRHQLVLAEAVASRLRLD
jgi:hypothetical protein